MDKSGANKAATDEINAGRENPFVVRQVKYLNNIVEQDHRAVKRVTKPMLNSKNLSVNNIYLEIHFAQRDDGDRKMVECDETALKLLIADL